MSDLDNLRPEVREALDVISGEAVCICHEAYASRGMKDPACNHDLAEDVETIRAELLRLAQENADFRRAFTDLSERHRASEGELAKLRARIAGAPLGVVNRCALNSAPEYNIMSPGSPLDGKRVRLVVEDGE